MESQFSLLRKLSNQPEMKRKIIGGVSEEDVNQLIKNIHQDYQQMESTYHNKLEELNNSKILLQSEFDDYIQKTTAEMEELKQELQATKNISSEHLTLCEEKDEIISNLNSNYTSEIEELTQKLNEAQSYIVELEHQKENIIEKNRLSQEKEMSYTKELDEAMTINHSLKEQMEVMKQEHEEEINQWTDAVQEFEQKVAKEQQAQNDYIQKIKDLEERLLESELQIQSNNDIHAIYRQLDTIKEQLTLIENLKAQLETEREKNQKAEEKNKQLQKILYDLKDGFFKEQEKFFQQIMSLK